MPTCVLLYSGGLDTSCSIKLLQERYGYDVVTVTVDVGQNEDLQGKKEKALSLGAVDAYVVDAKKEFADEYVAKAIKANALYQDAYPLSSALSRPLIAKWGVRIAREVEAKAIAHGCSGKGNDQVRFDTTISSLAPDLKIVAPIRELGLNREAEIEYAKKHQIPVPPKPVYSVDENLWGRSIECGILECLDAEPPEEVFAWTSPLEKAPDEAEYVTLEFEAGIPVKLNGERMELWELIVKLNEIAGKHGVGRIDHVEDRVVGLKSREVYECPAASVILKAHKDLEKLVCTKHENAFKPTIDQKWAELVYNGLWVDPLRSDLDAFIDRVNVKVEGIVRLKLYKGSAMVVGRDSPNALYDVELATYGGGSVFDERASIGFIELWSLQSRIASSIGRC